MENKKIQCLCRFVSICDLFLGIICTCILSFLGGLFLGLNVYLFLPAGMWIMLLLNILGIIAGVILTGAILTAAFLLWDGKKEEKPEKKPEKRKAAGLKVLKGEYAGAVFPMTDEETLTLGTHPEYCQILFKDHHISRVHCKVRYVKEKGTYEITNYSKKGTYLENGEKLSLNRTCSRLPGTVFMINHQKQVFQLL